MSKAPFEVKINCNVIREGRNMDSVAEVKKGKRIKLDEAMLKALDGKPVFMNDDLVYIKKCDLFIVDENGFSNLVEMKVSYFLKAKWYNVKGNGR